MQSSSSAVRYREYVSPTPLWWATAVLIASCTVFMSWPVSKLWAVISAVVVVGLVIAGLLAARTRIVLTDDELVAGRAHISADLLTGARAFDAEESFVQRGRELDARAFIEFRPWAKRVVRIDFDDPSDPTPYWLISSRRPDEFARAINERAAARARG